MRNKREPSDKWYRDILRAVQHSRCACCGEPRDDLLVAHVQLHAEGRGSVDVDRPENLVLACRPCNNRYLKKTMPAPHLPPNFLEQVAGLVLLKLQPKLGVDRASRVSGGGCTILTTKFTENTEVIDWQNSDFGLQSSTICTVRRDVDAEAVLQRFLVEATRSDCPPILPTGRNGDAIKQEMRRTINDVGESRWLLTARFYLRKEFYLQADGRAKWDSFGELAYNFATFDGLRVQAERRVAENERQQRDAAMRWRWGIYQRAADCGDWPGMKDEERAFRDKASSEKDVPARELSDEELARAEEMPRKEFRAKKDRCVDFLTLCDRMIEASEELRSSDYSTAFLRDGLARVTSVAGLHDLHQGIQEFYDMLQQYSGPPRPARDDNDF